MRIAWVAPCYNSYRILLPYLSDAESLGWEIHVYHDNQDNPTFDDNIYHLSINKLNKLKDKYIVIHYFLDNCNKCTDIKIKRLFGQRIFISRDTTIKFEDIIFEYLRKI